MRRFTHQDLNLAHPKTGEPKKAWKLLVEVCEHRGQRPWTDPPRRFNAFKQMVSELRVHLQSVFGIQEDPFPECTKASGLGASFRAYDGLPDDRATRELG